MNCTLRILLWVRDKNIINPKIPTTIIKKYRARQIHFFFLENTLKKKLQNIFSNFFFYLKVQFFRLIMEYHSNGWLSWPCSNLHDRLNIKVFVLLTRYYNFINIKYYTTNYANLDPLRRICNDFNNLYLHIDFNKIFRIY